MQKKNCRKITKKTAEIFVEVANRSCQCFTIFLNSSLYWFSTKLTFLARTATNIEDLLSESFERIPPTIQNSGIFLLPIREGGLSIFKLTTALKNMNDQFNCPFNCPIIHEIKKRERACYQIKEDKN